MGTDQSYEQLHKQLYSRQWHLRLVLQARFNLEAARHAHMHAVKVYPLKRPMLPVQARNKDPRIADAALRQLSDSVMYRMLALKTDPLFGLGAWTGGSDA